MRNVRESVEATAGATRRDRVLIAAHRGEPVEPGDQLAALLDVAGVLDRARIPYALIGGIAVGIHSAAPRATDDVDVAVPTHVARETVRSALEAAGFEARGEFPHTLNYRHPNGEPVQLAFDVSFDEMIERAEGLAVGDRTLRVVRKDDLIAMKERAGSDPARRRSKALRDQADAALLRGDAPEPDEGW